MQSDEATAITTAGLRGVGGGDLEHLCKEGEGITGTERVGPVDLSLIPYR